jgi:hypothetical protein
LSVIFADLLVDWPSCAAEFGFSSLPDAAVTAVTESELMTIITGLPF